jgi:hypothetical protein
MRFLIFFAIFAVIAASIEAASVPVEAGEKC